MSVKRWSTMSLCSLLLQHSGPTDNTVQVPDWSAYLRASVGVFREKRRPCLPFLWRSVFRVDFTGLCLCSTVEPSPAIIIVLCSSGDTHLTGPVWLFSVWKWETQINHCWVSPDFCVTNQSLLQMPWQKGATFLSTICRHNNLLIV